MAATPGFVLAATAGQATSVSLAWIGDAAGAVLPTTVSTALDATLKDLGYVTQDGATTSTALSTNDIPSSARRPRCARWSPARFSRSR
jgi:hypothetical protein